MDFFLFFFFFVLVWEKKKTRQIKNNYQEKKNLYHAIQVLQKQFGVLVSWVETFCFVCVCFFSFKKKKTLWSANVQYELE